MPATADDCHLFGGACLWRIVNIVQYTVWMNLPKILYFLLSHTFISLRAHIMVL